MTARRLLLLSKATRAQMPQPRTIAQPVASPYPSSFSSAILRPMQDTHRAFASACNVDDPNEVEAIFQKKRALRTKIRKVLKNMTPIQKAHEDNAVQRTVLEAPWFKSCRSLCAYVSSAGLREVDTSKILSEVLSNQSQDGHAKGRKIVYVPRVEDKFSNMKMLKVSGLDDLSLSSMDILEPNLVDSNGNQCEDVMQACEPVDIILLPGDFHHPTDFFRRIQSEVYYIQSFYLFACVLLGLAFDRSGRRLGRNGGYYDLFLKKYEENVKEKNWKHPLLVALAYSVQIVDEGAIAVTPNDVPVDALVSPEGFIAISSAGKKL